MRPLGILFRKELHGTFTSPIAYTMATVFLLVLSYTFSLTLFATKAANLNYIFHQIYVLSLLLIPVLTMRAFAEERRTDTLELLLTAPVREIWIVLAKFLAALSLMILMFAGTTAYALVLGIFLRRHALGLPLEIHGTGDQRRDFVHVRDVAGATAAALEAVAGPGVHGGRGTLRAYNVGSGTPRTVGELASVLADSCGGPGPVVTGEYRLGDVRHITASSERIRRELGWRATVPFAAGVAEFASAPAGRAAFAGRAVRATADVAAKLLQISYVERRTGLDLSKRPHGQ